MKFFKTKVSLAVFCGLFVLSGLALRIRLSPVREHPSAALEDAPPVSLLQPEQKPFVLIQRPSLPPPAGGILWESRSPAAVRAQLITPDPAWMTPEPVLKTGELIELALFDDVFFSARISHVTRYPNGAVGITAHLEGAKSGGTVFLSYCEGQMRASVEVPGGAGYCVRYNPATGEHIAIEVDRKNSIKLEGAEPRIAPGNDGMADEAAPADSPEPVALSDAPPGSTVVDVMIVYTPAALAFEGNVANMNLNIAQAMQRANEAHTNSNTQVYLNLVHSAQVTYTEINADKDLDNLTFSGGSYSAMDDVHVWRDQYGADLVCLFESTQEVGGLGWLLNVTNGNSSRAFCLARVQQSDWTYTVVHEWGHNMGCHHSKTQAIQSGPGLYSYSAGWQWSDTKANDVYPYTQTGYCTVMTYEDANNDGVQEYERIARFSNPSISYAGDSTNLTGHAANGDNARTIRQMKTVLAAYRTPPIIPPDTSPVTSYPYSESFETGYGYWSYTEGQIPWTRQTGGTPSDGTGPSGAFSGNYYMFIEASSQFSKNAQLRALFNFSGLSAPEIRFSYHMYGSAMGPLYLQVSTNGTVWSSLWSKSGNQGDQWFTTNVSLLAYGGRTNIHVRFYGVTPDFFGNGYGDMALDLITVQQSASADADDLDHDGLPNEWEILYFGGATNASPGAAAANGINTVMECYIAGLNPTNPASLFGVTVEQLPPSASVIRWNAVSGRVYSVYSSTNLPAGFLPLQTNIVFPQAGYTDAVNHAGRFYKLDVRLP